METNWFLADLVMEHRVEGEPRNVVRLNTRLVEADGPDEAWERALELGREAEMDYTNTDGRAVTVRFRGLRELQAIEDDLEHGAELTWSERSNVPEVVLQDLLAEKQELDVFQEAWDVADDEQPNLVPGDLAELLLDPSDLSGQGALAPVEPNRAPSPEAVRFARHAALVAAAELRRRGMTEKARGAEYLAEALEAMLTGN